MCVNTERHNQCRGQVLGVGVGWGVCSSHTHTHTIHTLLSTHFFAGLYEKTLPARCPTSSTVVVTDVV